MVLPTAKRKSESALPPTKSRNTDLSQSPSPEAEQLSNDGFSIQEAPVAAKRVKKDARKSEAAPKARNRNRNRSPKPRADDEYDEDVGRIESQSFLSLVAFETKKKYKTSKENKGYMEKFEKGVIETQTRLKTAMAEGKKASKKRDDDFLETFKTAYGAARGNVPLSLSSQSQSQSQSQSNTQPPAQDFAAMYSKSKEITATAFALVAKFEEVAKRVEEIDTTALVENEWGDQDQALRKMLLTGLSIGVDRYTRMLHDSKEEAVLEGEEKETSKVLFGEKMAEGPRWGSVARKQERALRKLGKTLEGGVEVV